MSAELERELAEVMATLGPQDREEVLEFARSLKDDDDTPTPSLLRFAGSISREDAELMRRAIEEEFGMIHGAA
jgi:hypothetical protein